MEQVTVFHACGHAGKHGLSGSAEDRARRAAWLQRQPCAACWRAAQRTQAEEARTAAGLPPLAGSAQEIAWAEVLRMKCIAHNRAYYARLGEEAAAADEAEFYGPAMQAAEAALHDLEHETSAAWWLEHRFALLDYVKQRIVEAMNPPPAPEGDDPSLST